MSAFLYAANESSTEGEMAMFSLAHSATVNEERMRGLLAGRWGSSRDIREHSVAWYEGLGVDGAAARSGELHPIVEYAANCKATGDPCLVDLDSYIERSDVVTVDLQSPVTWEPEDTGADNDLVRLVNSRCTPDAWAIRSATPEIRSDVAAAVSLLMDAAPELGGDALAFTKRHIVMHSDRMIGRTWVDTGGLIISGDPAFASTAQLAESLFHESLHAKYYSIERGMQIPTPDEGNSPTPVEVPWQHDLEGRPQRWTAQRSLDAFHVYVHLGVFRLGLLQKTGRDDDLERLRRICFRAAYLSRQIRVACLDVLDEERKSIFTWLDACRVPEFDLNDAGLGLLARADLVAS